MEGRDTPTLVTAGSDTLLKAPSLVKILGGASEIALIAVTLGEIWDVALDELAAKNEPAEAWFLDALGTAMTDLAARAVEDRIAGDMARAGLTRTRRYRPGYGDWGLEGQGEICELVEADRIGVRVNEAFALLPRKSVTGIVGFGERSDPSPPEEDGEADEDREGDAGK
jgi:cobalamin-dependent methionine synthase I